jgi:hypothetical protein
MKTLLVVIVLLAAGYVGYAKFLRATPERACARITQLCTSAEPVPAHQRSCVAFFDKLDANSETHPAEVVQCVLDAHSCSQAIGCTAGGAMKLGVSAAGDFFDGFQQSMK